MQSVQYSHFPLSQAFFLDGSDAGKVDKTSWHRGTARWLVGEGGVQKSTATSLWSSQFPLTSAECFSSPLTYQECLRSGQGLFLFRTHTIQPAYSKCTHFNRLGSSPPPPRAARCKIPNHLTLLSCPLKK